ncbi:MULTISPECIES: hypothetical protein [Chryseobacterium]|uniref:Uncharacterized protein n=1 Tax=Chryseobacterium camelliae TaxID=1265445 RepID=A0ABU0TD17_9FLAO|nr:MULTISPECIES: hypothetical protein [Chryseobacterium]MDT3407238.1 hypothetical protein [Pseudacidovorax intermedius]MDQ1094973.1 hypothetical protein [Chryseobacterium camelliae]MDQ1098912.1 hypothetical protein [Chryseobacterium sp. SORGH_AS_1048]MDR6086261.1 hypothetical protein [Chryseobacterium sp. SORGH_AS_0909]MDR6130632.1 hypothetical protein [Chryseobacterium sp. SORGH_AS_1175]
MKKKLFMVASSASSLADYSQVGINNHIPDVPLDHIPGKTLEILHVARLSLQVYGKAVPAISASLNHEF